MYLHGSLDLCNDVLESENEEFPSIRPTAVWLKIWGQVVLQYQVESIGWCQFELHEVAVDLGDHVLQKEVLLGLVEGEGGGED